MKTTLIRIIAPALFALFSGCNGSISKGEGVTLFLEPLGDGDLALAPGGVGLVSGVSLAEAVNFEKLPTGLSWRLDGSEVRETPEPHLTSSKGFWIQRPASQFAQGATVPVSSPGAVIKLSPAPSVARSAVSRPIPIDDLVFTDAFGAVYDAADAIDAGSTSDEFRAGEMPFAPGTTVLKLRSDLSVGALRLGLREGAVAPSYDVLLQVLEPNSDTVLELQSTADAYLQGQTLEVVARWRGNVIPKSGVLQGEVRSPSGTRTPLQLQVGPGGTFVGRLPLTETATRPGELWEIQVEAEADGENGPTLRTARTAFAYSAGTASFEPTVSLPEWPSLDNLRVRFGLQVASAGRYAVTGVLYGTSPTGELKPFMVSQAATTVEPGTHSLELVFEGVELAANGLSAPYQIRDLRLLDQTRLGLLHRQAFALVLPR